MTEPPPSAGHAARIALGLFALFFLAILPTTPWLEFAAGMENVNVATSLETLRTGHWLVPSLNGEPRTRKPPLATWMAAVGIKLTGSLPWGARLPNLLCTALTVVATFYFGRLLAGERTGLIAALIAGSCYLFLAQATSAQYDMPLALFVTLANLHLAMVLLEGRWFVGCIGAGVWLGLACMTKGPVALLMTLFPIGCFALLGGTPPRQPGQHPAPLRTRLLAIVAGVAILLLLTLPWMVYVDRAVPGRLSEWVGQATQRTERATEKHTWWWKYVLVFPWFAPWTIWYIVALAGLAFDHFRPRRRQMTLALVMVVLPLVVMSFFPARRPRYVVPLVAPMAILAAWRLQQHFSEPRRWSVADRLVVIGHGAMVSAFAVGLPVIGMFAFPFARTVSGGPWYSPAVAIPFLLVALVILGLMWWRLHDWRYHVGGTTVLMLMLFALFIWGYRTSDAGSSSGKDLALRLRRDYPHAVVYNCNPTGRDAPLEMSIYLDTSLARYPNPADLPSLKRPQIALVPGNEDKPPEIRGFRVIDRSSFDGSWWYALLKE